MHINENDNYEYLIKRFGENKISSRYEWVYGLMEDFIKINQMENQVRISKEILNHVIVDYFVDIARLKEFQNIKKTHETKIYAYLTFWIVRHKPLQLKDDTESDKLAFVNEEFASYLLRSYLFADPEDIPISNNKVHDIDDFVLTLLYYLKYRDYSAKSIEIILLAFIAGRGYQYSADYQERD